MRLNAGLNRGSNEGQRNQRCQPSNTNIDEKAFNETSDVGQVVQIYMKMRLNPGLNGDSNDAQQNQRFSNAIQIYMNMRFGFDVEWNIYTSMLRRREVSSNT